MQDGRYASLESEIWFWMVQLGTTVGTSIADWTPHQVENAAKTEDMATCCDFCARMFLAILSETETALIVAELIGTLARYDMLVDEGGH